MNTNKVARNIVTTVFLSGLTLASSYAIAQDSDATGFGSTFSGWSGTATLGATTSSGNAEASNVNGSIRLSKTVNRWEHLVFGTIFKGRSSIIVDTAELEDAGLDINLEGDDTPERVIVTGNNSDRLSLGYQPRFFYSQKTYFFGLLDWEQDEPANIDTATRQIIGIGHKFYNNASGFLTAEAGFGNKATNLVVGDDVDGAIAYVGFNFLNRITDTVTFNADLRSDFGSDNTFIELGLGVSFKLSDTVAFKIDHFSRSNSDLGDLGSDDDISVSASDSVTSLNLVFDI